MFIGLVIVADHFGQRLKGVGVHDEDKGALDHPLQPVHGFNAHSAHAQRRFKGRLNDIGGNRAEDGRFLFRCGPCAFQNRPQIFLKVSFVFDLLFQIDEDLFKSTLDQLIRRNLLTVERLEDIFPLRRQNVCLKLRQGTRNDGARRNGHVFVMTHIKIVP